MQDELFTIDEAARYAGVWPSSIRRCWKAAGIPFEEKASVRKKRRIVQAVRKSHIDIFRANGFLVPKRLGRHKNRTRRDVGKKLTK